MGDSKLGPLDELERTQMRQWLAHWEVARAAADTLQFLQAQGRPACAIGGIVVSRWGEPRATSDVDWNERPNPRVSGQ